MTVVSTEYINMSSLAGITNNYSYKLKQPATQTTKACPNVCVCVCVCSVRAAAKRIMTNNCVLALIDLAAEVRKVQVSLAAMVQLLEDV